MLCGFLSRYACPACARQREYSQFIDRKCKVDLTINPNEKVDRGLEMLQTDANWTIGACRLLT